MMQINTSHFHTQETAVTETMTDILFVLIITMKDIQENGTRALNAKKILKQRCMSIMEQTSITLKNLKILLLISRLDVLNATVLYPLGMMLIRLKEMNIYVSIVALL